jgi:hypothetical protein
LVELPVNGRLLDPEPEPEPPLPEPLMSNDTVVPRPPIELVVVESSSGSVVDVVEPPDITVLDVVLDGEVVVVVGCSVVVVVVGSSVVVVVVVGASVVVVVGGSVVVVVDVVVDVVVVVVVVDVVVVGPVVVVVVVWPGTVVVVVVGPGVVVVVVVGATVVDVVVVDVVVGTVVVLVVAVWVSANVMVRYASAALLTLRLVVTRTLHSRQVGTPTTSGSFGPTHANNPPCGFSPLNGLRRKLMSSAANVAVPLSSAMNGAFPVAPSQWSFGCQTVGGAGFGSEPSHCSMNTC